MKRKVLVFILVLFICPFVRAEENGAETAIKNLDNTERLEEVESGDDEKVSEFDEKKNVILYGIESEIVELIKKLEKDEDSRFDNEIFTLFSETKSPFIRETIFDFFAKKKNPQLQEEADKIIGSYTDNKKNTVKAALNYVKELELKESSSILHDIIKDYNSENADTAISVLGKIGQKEDALFLVEYFENVSAENEKKTLIIKQNIMAALENLHEKETWDFLLNIINDENENSIIRASAVSALGKIGDEQAVPIICGFFENQDPILRAAAVKGLSGYQNKEAEKVFLQGCKDSHYKVRLQAINSVREEKNLNALPYILQRAKTDPEISIRIAAAETLAEFNVSESNTWLVEVFNDKKTSSKVKVKIAESLLKNNFALIYPHFSKAVSETLKDEKNKKLRYEFGKILARVDNLETADLAELFLKNKDVLTKSLGLDMFKKNRYPSLTEIVRQIAEEKAKSTLKKRAASLLEASSLGQDKKEN